VNASDTKYNAVAKRRKKETQGLWWASSGIREDEVRTVVDSVHGNFNRTDITTPSNTSACSARGGP
jgi:hypothetical protein